jgi:hypothetical protein
LMSGALGIEKCGGAPPRRHYEKVARGSSDNPGGRPRIVEDIRRLAREHTETAIKTLCRIAERGKQATRVASATTPLDRGGGGPLSP